MGPGIRIIRFDPHSNHGLLKRVIGCYRKVFAEAPWHEWKKCPSCGKYWGKKDLKLLQDMEFRHCNYDLEDYWSWEKVEKDLKKEVTSEASCWIAVIDNSVVGFCWGFPIKIDSLEKKVGIEIKANLEENFGKINKVAYQDELGVLAPYRGQKIAKRMFIKRHKDFISKGLKIAVIRTREKPEPSVTYLWFTQKLKYKVIASYQDGRVVLATELKNLSRFL